MKPVLVTSNPGKLREAEEILGADLEREDVDLDEIQAVEVSKVVGAKSEAAYDELGRPVIVTDTGLYIEDFNGFPGALVRWMFERVGNEGIAELASGSEAEAELVIGYHDGEQLKTFSGRVRGEIAEKPRGEKGFGWNPVFIPDGYEETFAEMGEESKNSIFKDAFSFSEEDLEYF